METKHISEAQYRYSNTNFVKYDNWANGNILVHFGCVKGLPKNRKVLESLTAVSTLIFGMLLGYCCIKTVVKLTL